MLTRPVALGVVSVSLLLVASGCIGNVRKTTSETTATQQLLMTTAVDRALAQFSEQAERVLGGKKVNIDVEHVEEEKKPYATSALRNLITSKRATVAGPEEKGDVTLEVRSGAVGIMDHDFGFGLPSLPLPIPNTTLSSIIPSLYLFRRDKQEGWAKFNLWVLDNGTGEYIAQSKDLWGHAYYSLWTILALGPFDFSNDIYPDAEVYESDEE